MTAALSILIPATLIVAAAINPRIGADGKPLPRNQRTLRGDLLALVR
jgi:hypothetical protein